MPVVENKAKLSLSFWFQNETDSSMMCAIREDFNLGKCKKFKLKKTGSNVSLPGVRKNYKFTKKLNVILGLVKRLYKLEGISLRISNCYTYMDTPYFFQKAGYCRTKSAQQVASSWLECRVSFKTRSCHLSTNNLVEVRRPCLSPDGTLYITCTQFQGQLYFCNYTRKTGIQCEWINNTLLTNECGAGFNSPTFWELERTVDKKPATQDLQIYTCEVVSITAGISNIYRIMFACCFVWVWNFVSQIEGGI